ncbi:hypothetical protein K458DRAFT_406094 [Lentithecium fluviatile CBS 122367]|uniref:Mid2 domain-containing protein n=1 Tax=Lentithecium fluviatile CBS 122367 TaxID=1168545 RepID=A0A6G1IV73_9PLEO|nr:hypothetical protein K458DRAFT_406094 [Lentithecium fluviatile CBS 122367]
MFLFLLGALLAASTLAEEQFLWSYMPENTTRSYEPLFQVCGSSCSDCDPAAKPCFAENWSNLCYEPKLGETCCQDQFGTSCYVGYYCAYDEDNVGFCCAEDDEEEDCAKALNVTLSHSEPQEAPTTVSPTAVFTPSITASDQSIVHRPERTHLPLMPGTYKGSDHDPEDQEVERDVSTAVKIGIAVGAVVGGAILVTLVVMWVLHRRNVSRYAKLGEMKPKGDMHAGHPHPEQRSHVMPAMMPGAAHPHASAYEPMRNQPPHDPRASWVSPAVSREPSPRRSPAPAYTDRPAAFLGASQHHSIELTHMPPTSPDPFGQNHQR